jgi:adenosylcobinamide kinase/adenosylcobinamide-phosphate guanylyltransferase
MNDAVERKFPPGMVKSHLPPLSLVTGAAASGKSAFAERLCGSGEWPARYVATMRRSSDPELRERIRRHEIVRGRGWTTAEVPLEVARHVGELREGVALVDCATLWLANALEAGRGEEAPALAGALAEAAVPVVVVSNELGWGMVPMDAGTRAFRDAHGRMNQALAARAGLVVLVASGLPLVLKGGLPEGFA